MLLVVAHFAFVDATIGVAEDAPSIHAVVCKLAFVLCTIVGKFHFPSSLGLVVDPVTFVHVTICPAENSVTVLLVVYPFAFVNVSVFPSEFALSVRQVIFDLTFVLTATLELQNRYGAWHGGGRCEGPMLATSWSPKKSKKKI